MKNKSRSTIKFIKIKKIFKNHFDRVFILYTGLVSKGRFKTSTGMVETFEC